MQSGKQFQGETRQKCLEVYFEEAHRDDKRKVQLKQCSSKEKAWVKVWYPLVCPEKRQICCWRIGALLEDKKQSAIDAMTKLTAKKNEL